MKKNIIFSLLLTGSKNSLPLLLLILIFFNSCTSSLYPISEDEKEYIIKDELFENWKEKDGSTEYIVEHTEDVYFRITVIDKDEPSGAGQLPVSRYDTSRFSAFLIKKNNVYFLDCFVDIYSFKKSGYSKNVIYTLLPMHMIFKIQNITQDQFRISALESALLKKYFVQRKDIKHETLSNDVILLTEKPTGLQQKLYTNPSIFGEVTTFNRIK